MIGPAVPASASGAAVELPRKLGAPLEIRHGGAGTGRRRTLLTLAGLMLASVQPAAAAEPPAAARIVSIENERLRLEVDAMPLSQVLALLDQDGPVAIRLQGDPTGIQVTAAFEGVELREGLRRLLAAHSHILVELGGRGEARPTLEVILLGRTTERHPASAGDERLASADFEFPERSPASIANAQRLEERPAEELAHMARSAGSSGIRAAALDALAYAAAGNEDATAYAGKVLEQALSDPDRRVRARAMATLKDTAEELPVDSLARLAREDPQPRLRTRALELLLERSEEQAHGSLRAALVDPDPIVHERAKALIEDLHIELDGD